MSEQSGKKNLPAAFCRPEGTGATAYKLLINLRGYVCICGMSAPNNLSGRTSSIERAVWHSPIVTDTSVRRILDFQTVPG